MKFAIAILLFIGFGFTVNGQSKQIKLRGRIVDDQGKGIARVVFYNFNNPTVKKVSDYKGEFEIFVQALRANESVKLVFSKIGYDEVTEPFYGDNLNHTITLPPKKLTITLSVFETGNQSTVDGYSVLLNQLDNREFYSGNGNHITALTLKHLTIESLGREISFSIKKNGKLLTTDKLVVSNNDLEKGQVSKSIRVEIDKRKQANNSPEGARNEINDEGLVNNRTSSSTKLKRASVFNHVVPGTYQLKNRLRGRKTYILALVTSVGLGYAGYYFNNRFENSFREAQSLMISSSSSSLIIKQFNDLVNEQSRQKRYRKLSFIGAGGVLLFSLIFNNHQINRKSKSSEGRIALELYNSDYGTGITLKMNL